MKHTAKLLISLILILTMTGCGNNGNDSNRVNNGNSVDKVISQQMQNDSTASEGQSTDITPQSGTATGEENSPTEQENANIQNNGDVDYDLTTMNSDMVYAMVYQMMTDPDTYIGKTFRMDGLYYASYYEPTAKYYHCCLIQDALACCAQGMEFVWDDGSHIYPDEYPENNTEVVVQGVFETYREDGDVNLYCRLKDATLEVVDN